MNVRKPKLAPISISWDGMLDTLFAEYRRQGMTIDEISEAADLTRSTVNSFRKYPCVDPKFKTILKMIRGAGMRIILETEDGRRIDPYGAKE
jgi:hypothetical protein